MIEKLKTIQLELIHMRTNLGVTTDKLFEVLREQYEDGDEVEAIERTAKDFVASVKRNNGLYNIICELDNIIEGR